MASLIERIAGVNTEPKESGTGNWKIASHIIVAGAAEVKRGNIQGSTLISVLEIQAGIQTTQLTELNSQLTSGALARDECHDVFLLLERGYYSVSQAETRLNLTAG